MISDSDHEIPDFSESFARVANRSPVASLKRASTQASLLLPSVSAARFGHHRVSKRNTVQELKFEAAGVSPKRIRGRRFSDGQLNVSGTRVVDDQVCPA